MTLTWDEIHARMITRMLTPHEACTFRDVVTSGGPGQSACWRSCPARVAWEASRVEQPVAEVSVEELPLW